MGALISAAVPRLRCPGGGEPARGDSVVSVHVGYIRAGAELIETNTFGANRPKLAASFLEDEFERINSAGVRLAREAREMTGADVFIAGSIGPLGDVELRPESRAELFAEQASILEGRGADVFMVETFYDLDELEEAIAAVRSVSSLPIVALMTFDEEGQTLGGVSARQAGTRLAEVGVAAVGREPRRRPRERARRAAGDAAQRARPRRAAERRSRESRRAASRLPARDARVLRGVRRTGARARRGPDRRLLRHDARGDRGDSRRGGCEPAAVGPARHRRARA